jgi:hypothetical protein
MGKIYKFYVLSKDMQVFKYYKELIEFHKCGDPVFFMKCINPKEAQYIDYSSGLHIRFRLAGVCFASDTIKTT